MQGLDLDRVCRECAVHIVAHGVNDCSDSVAAHQKAVRVDAVGRAGDQGAQVLAGHDDQGRDVVGQNSPDLVHLVGHGLVENAKGEGIALLQFIEVCEDHDRHQSSVPREHAMGSRPADRQG